METEWGCMPGERPWWGEASGECPLGIPADAAGGAES